MAERLDHLKPGDVLAQAELATYIGAMGLGIAEAQRALDGNSLSQLGEFVKPLPGVPGLSLIQLGLLPAFYHFRSATLSCSISMSLQVRQQLEAGVAIGAGSSSTMTKKVVTGSKVIKTFADEIVVSKTSKVKATQNTSGMKAIHSYSEQNTATGEYFALAERASVTAASNFSASATSLAQYDSQAALFVVSPGAGLQWAVVRIDPASVVSDPAVKGFILSSGTTSQLGEVRFDNDSYAVTNAGGVDYAQRLRALAAIIKVANLTSISITGHTDGIGPTAYNLRLSTLRAEAVKDVLRANQVPAAAIGAVSGTGEQGAVDNVANPALRNVTVSMSLSASYIYLEETTAGALTLYLQAHPPASATDILVQGSYPAAANVQNGTTTVSTATTAAALATAINNAAGSTVEASDVGELVYLTNKTGSSTTVADVTVYAKDESGFTQDETTNFDQKVESSSSSTTTQVTEKDVKRASAIGFSLDARYARSFDLSMSGNMSIAAEMVSIPAPPEFLKFVNENLKG
jgi:outer membrane protein OmpA-like peptidoglycan-associated protein